MIEWSFRLRLHVFQFLFCLRSLEKCKSKPLDRFSRAQSHEWNEWPQALCTSTQTTTTLNENGKATWNKTIFFFFFIGNRLRFIFESQRRHLNAQKWRIKQSEMFPYRFASCELIHFFFAVLSDSWELSHRTFRTKWDLVIFRLVFYGHRSVWLCVGEPKQCNKQKRLFGWSFYFNK